MITLGIWLAERGMLPDFILRVAVKFLSKAKVRMPNVFSEKLKVLNTLKAVSYTHLTLPTSDLV